MEKICILSLLALAGAVAVPGQGDLIAETFDDASSSATFDAAPAGDLSVTFGFNYGAITLTAPGTPVDGTAIPEAPSTPIGAAATRGLATGANLAGGSPVSLSLFTADEVSGDFIVEVDVFYYHDNNSGSTEDPMVGINHSGIPIAFQLESSALPGPTDGYFFKTFGDIDVAGNDVFLLEGRNGAITVDPATGLTWGDGLLPDIAGRDMLGVAFFQNALTGYPTGATTPGGAFRWAWQTVQIVYNNDVLSLFVNGTRIATYDDPDDTFTSGKIMLGHEDTFGSLNANNLMIFDNLNVTQIIITDVEEWNLYE